ncbi:hypothetical protein JB92DRAFT_2829110 [Gautieria morchelliformis]|nr:hypothetical protein JB92DRAFT_2829110 [Gautieria morchelliformis]
MDGDNDLEGQDGWPDLEQNEIGPSSGTHNRNPHGNNQFKNCLFSRPGLGSKAPVTARPETARASQNPGRAFFYGSGPAPARLGFGPGLLEHGRRVKKSLI